MEKVLITGSGGLIGQELSRKLQLMPDYSNKINLLSTNIKEKKHLQNIFLWNVNDKKIDEKALEGVGTIVHLAGAGIANKRWTANYKQTILDSRVKSAELLLNVLERRNQKLKQFITASGIGYYPDPGSAILKENDKPGSNFMSEVCKQWEAAAWNFKTIAEVVTALRIGPVLSNKGGILPVYTMTKPLLVVPITGRPGNMLSWIHLDDLVRIFLFVLENKKAGVFNAVAPNPVSMKSFAHAVGNNRFCLHPVIPPWVLNLALGEKAMLANSDQNVSAEKLISENFEFKYPTLELALADLSGEGKS